MQIDSSVKELSQPEENSQSSIELADHHVAINAKLSNECKSDTDSPVRLPLLDSQGTPHVTDHSELQTHKPVSKRICSPGSFSAFFYRMILSFCFNLAKEIPTHVLLSSLLAVLGGLATRFLCTGNSSQRLALAWCPDRNLFHKEYLELGRNVMSLEQTLRSSMHDCTPVQVQDDGVVQDFASFDAGALPILEFTSPTFRVLPRPDV